MRVVPFMRLGSGVRISGRVGEKQIPPLCCGMTDKKQATTGATAGPSTAQITIEL
jgi:hypothetical protein